MFIWFASVMRVRFVMAEQIRSQVCGLQPHHLRSCDAIGLDATCYGVPAVQQNSLSRTTPFEHWDYRYSQHQLEALFRQAREEDVEESGRCDLVSAALNISTHPRNNTAMREETSLIGTFYTRWADENRLWKAEIEEGFLFDDVLEVLGALEEQALGRRFTGDERERDASESRSKRGF